MRFGGRLREKDDSPDADDNLGGQWETLHTRDVINVEPRMWRFSFGKDDQIVSAELSTVFVHPV